MGNVASRLRHRGKKVGNSRPYSKKRFLSNSERFCYSKPDKKPIPLEHVLLTRHHDRCAITGWHEGVKHLWTNMSEIPNFFTAHLLPIAASVGNIPMMHLAFNTGNIRHALCHSAKNATRNGHHKALQLLKKWQDQFEHPQSGCFHPWDTRYLGELLCVASLNGHLKCMILILKWGAKDAGGHAMMNAGIREQTKAMSLLRKHMSKEDFNLVMTFLDNSSKALQLLKKWSAPH